MIHSFFKANALVGYLLLVACAFSFPSDGGHGLVNPKSIFFLFSIFATSIYFLLKGYLSPLQWKLGGGGISFLTFLVFEMLVSLMVGRTDTGSNLDQAKLFIITIIPCLMAYLLIEEKILTFSLFLKTAIYANFIYILLKFVCIICLLFGFFSIVSFIEATGIRVMSMNVLDNFSRFQTSVDIFSPFLLFFLLHGSQFQVVFLRGFVFFGSLLFSFSILFSFSRVLIFLAFVAFFLHSFSYSVNRFLKSFLVFSLLCAGFIAQVGIEPVQKMVERRLFSGDNQASDDTRKDQVEALFKEIELRPLLGLGVGGYAESNIRDEEVPHSYEVQWVALLAQLGFLGIFVLLSLLLMNGFFLFTPPYSMVQLSALLMYIAWILSGFTNPFVISLGSSMMYTLFGLYGFETRRYTHPSLECNFSHRKYPHFCSQRSSSCSRI